MEKREIGLEGGTEWTTERTSAIRILIIVAIAVIAVVIVVPSLRSCSRPSYRQKIETQWYRSPPNPRGIVCVQRPPLRCSVDFDPVAVTSDGSAAKLELTDETASRFRSHAPAESPTFPYGQARMMLLQSARCCCCIRNRL